MFQFLSKLASLANFAGHAILVAEHQNDDLLFGAYLAILTALMLHQLRDRVDDD